ncbi:MAG: hypothetical protein V3V97_20910, partial [Hyphomicrobiaceae bacterium]
TAFDRMRRWLANWQRRLNGAAAATTLKGGTDDFVSPLPMVRMTLLRHSRVKLSNSAEKQNAAPKS